MNHRILLAALGGSLTLALTVTAAAPRHDSSRPRPAQVLEVNPATGPASTTTTTTAPAPETTTTRAAQAAQPSAVPRRPAARPATTTTTGPRRTAGESPCPSGSPVDWSPSCLS